ncbi:hypothetical protein CHLRE_09g416000v5 [Chlamydomonas reinhardtii]|uniref:Uncharacterized protein n=1 Tax=Chlamydomonas reinhardtii TaxID=3055 RepID=A0A2K3DFZ6_CHLRE|nr:uncharacterized protein CHLRE_09g416000v5 [Chlamydomonas reinhardtii]PNW79461.1 hypothetical protein CHLRE_09g416000v5 [Chlamydomonas reinhardtii]
MDKRAADGAAGGAPAPAPKRGRWDAGPDPGHARAPVPGVPGNPAAAAAALAAAVAAKYAPPIGVRPPAPMLGIPGLGLTPGAAAAVAQAAAAALQKLPLATAAAPSGLPAAPATAAGAAGEAAAKPSLSLEALEKAKKALQLQKEIKEKLAKSKLAQLASKLQPPAAPGAAVTNGGAAVPPSAIPGVRPPLLPGLGAAPLAPPIRPPPGITSVLPPPLLPPVAPEPEEETGAFHDPILDRGAAGRRGERRRRAGFDFVQEGRFQREAELFRMKSQLGSGAFRKGAPRVSGPLSGPGRLPLPGAPPGSAGGAGGGLAGLDANLVPLGVREVVPQREATPVPEAEPVPAVEWWDRGLLAHGSLDQDVPELPAAALLPRLLPLKEANGEGPHGGDSGRMDEGEGEDGLRVSTLAEAAEATADSRQQLAAAAAAAAAGQLGAFRVKDARITIYVEHPVPLDPPAEAPPPPPQPLKLTARELKKLRTQRRLARDKEKQELIRQGLLEPPKPKVRIANLHRVLGTDASLDPTAVEKEVRKQMAERQAAHEDRNLARKLTPAERRDKKLRKLFGVAAVEAGVTEVAGAGKKGGAAAAAAASGAAAAAAGVDLVCSVYRVGRLTDPQHRFKVDANARENHMTGMTIVSDDFSLVVVEGVDKATRRYLKLMMRRIDWSTAPATAPPPGGSRDANGDAAMEDEDEDAPPNVCTLVWQGTVLRRAFVGFRTETVRSAAAGRQLLEELGVGHYWDAAAGATEGESVPYTL